TGGSAWSLDGLVQIGEDAVFHTRAEWNPSRTTIDAQAPRGGRIQLERRSSQRWSVRAQGFPLAVLHEVWPGRPAGVDLKRATLSGGAEAVLDEDGLRLNVQRMTLDALALDDRRLAKVPIELSAVQLDGSATLHDRQ